MEANQTVRSGTSEPVRPWLKAYQWEDVVWTLSGFWHLSPEQIEGATCRQTRDLWEREAPRSQTLSDALRLCRRCQAAKPFGKYDCESFVIIARDLVKPFLGEMSATLATAVITIIGDYVRGSGDEHELQQTIKLIMERFAGEPGQFHHASPGGL